MSKDLRDLIKKFDETPVELSSNHTKKFEKKLEELHATSRNTNFFFMKIAALLLLTIGVGYRVVTTSHNSKEVFEKAVPVNLSSISPEMQKIETYYQAAINFELASLQPTKENTVLIDSYLDKIGKLDRDYKRLHKELVVKGIDTTTVNKLITNLQLRLQLLLQLKDQIQELQTVNQKDHEATTI